MFIYYKHDTNLTTSFNEIREFEQVEVQNDGNLSIYRENPEILFNKGSWLPVGRLLTEKNNVI